METFLLGNGIDLAHGQPMGYHFFMILSGYSDNVFLLYSYHQ